MEPYTCPCGASISEKDKMGSESYICSKCLKTFRPEQAKRQAREEAGGKDPGAQWKFAKWLLVGVGVGGLVLFIIIGGILISAMPRNEEGIFKTLATIYAGALISATFYAERARRLARKAQGKDPNQLF